MDESFTAYLHRVGHPMENQSPSAYFMDLSQKFVDWADATGDNQNRIEALRAASRIVAGVAAGGQSPMLHGEAADTKEFSLSLAEQFAKWLETGER